MKPQLNHPAAKGRPCGKSIPCGGLVLGLLSWLVTLTLQAGPITWGPATTVSGNADVSTTGTPLYAYFRGGANQTVNGVTFTAEPGGQTWGNVSFSGFGNDYTAFVSATAPFGSLSSAYSNVLSGGVYGGTGSGTVTLNGLTFGHAYSVQIWINDARSYGAGRNGTATSSGGNSVTLNYNSTGAAGGVGQTAVGTFVAGATSQTFTLTPNSTGSVQLNALQVRDQGYAGTPTAYSPTRFNLAKYQPVMTDSTNGTQSAGFITDGFLDDDSGWVSDNSGPHWAEVVFPFPVTVGSAQLAMGLKGSSPLTIFELQYLTNGTWANVPGGQILSNTNVERNIVFTSPVTATAFRVYDTFDNPIRIRQFALYPPAGTNGYPFGTDVAIDLARKQPAFATANTPGGWPLLAADGRISASSAWQTTLVGSNSLLINLQFTNKIGSAHLYSGMTGVPPLSNFVLQYWDGGAWANIPGGSISSNTSGALVIPFTSAVTTTKVQLVFTNTGTSAVQELCVFPANSNGGYPLGTGIVSNTPVSAKYDTYSDSYYYLSNSASAQVILESNGVPVTGSGALTNWLAQYQVLLNYDNGTYTLLNRASGLCLAGAQLTTNSGAALVEEAYAALPDQEWFLQSVDGVNFYLQNQFSGLVADVQNGGLVQNPLTNSPSQYWQLPLAQIFPKKGIAGSWSGRPVTMAANWSYSWWYGSNPNIPGVNYFPMDQSLWNRNGYVAGNLWSYQPGWRTSPYSLHVLGYNEPDQVGQADIDATNGAIGWMNDHNLDLPLVAPAAANVSGTWNQIFYGYITNWGARVDYLPAHEYPGNNTNGSSGIWINTLQSAYNTYGYPMWMTEFSVVDWGGTGYWDEEDNYSALAEFLWRAESLPWLRKYSLFDFGSTASSPPAVNPWTRTTPAPSSVAFDTNGLLTPFGELYAGWDDDATVETNKVYQIYHSGTRKQLANLLAPQTPDARSILVRDSATQWTLQAAPTAGQYYVVSSVDGRRLGYNGASVVLLAAGTTGTAVQWQLTPYQYGWYYLDHPASGLRLQLGYNNSTFAATFSMVAQTTTGLAVQWRFTAPYNAPVVVWTGSSNASWTASGNWSSTNLSPAVFQGSDNAVVFNNLSTGNLATVLNLASNPAISNTFAITSLTVSNPPGPVSISATNLLAIGSFIDLSQASQDLTINSPVYFGECQGGGRHFWTVASGRNLTLNGNVNGAADLVISGGGSVTLGGTNFSAGSLALKNATLGIGGSGQFGGGNFTGLLTNNGTFYYHSTANQTLSGSVLGSGALVMSSPAALTLTGTNYYTGPTTVSNGTLAVSATGELYAGGYTYTPVVTVNSGGNLQLSSWAYAALGGLGDLDFGAARLLLNGGTITYTGTGENTGFNNGRLFTIGAGGATLNAAGTGTWYLENDSTYGSQNIPSGLALTLGGGGNGQFDNSLTGSGALVKSGTGTWTLTGPNTYTGSTTVSAGTLALRGSSSLTNSPQLLVAGGATLNVSGLATPFTLAGRTLANSSVGARLNGTNNCSSGTLALVVDGVNPAFVQTNGLLTFSSNTMVSVNNLGNPLAPGTYSLIAAVNSGNVGHVAGTLPTVSVVGNGAVGPTTLQINANGGLDLVVTRSALTPAVITGVTWSGSNFTLFGSNGAWSGTYSVLTATNLSLPVSSWATGALGTFTPAGTFSNGLPVSSAPQQFFLIKQP